MYSRKNGSLDNDTAIEMYRRMWLIRAFEAQVIELFKRALIRGSTHVYVGQEAVAIGACAALQGEDLITSTHRGHGHCIAKGGDLKPMMAELLGKATGYCRGKGGSMHIADLDIGILGANGIVGGGISIAVGAALSCQYLENGKVVICFFGDGAINLGVFHESANLAAIWCLPIIFLCENNIYAVSTRIEEAVAIPDLAERAKAYGFPGVSVDGDDVLAVYEATREAVGRARRGEGPSLIVANTYRWEGHMVGDPQFYRTKEEVEERRKKDPITLFQIKLEKMGILDEKMAEAIRDEARTEAQQAVEYALASPDPAVEELWHNVYV